MATFLERLCDAERLANRDSVFLQRFDDHDTGADPKLISLIDGEYGIDAAHGTPLEYSGSGIQLLPVAGGPGIGSNQTGDIASRYNEGGLGGSAFVMAWHGWCEVRSSGTTYEYICGDLAGATGNAITIRHSGISNRLGIFDGALRDSFYTLTTGYHSIIASKQLTGGLTDIFVDGYLVASVTTLGASGGHFAVGSAGKNQSGNRSNSYTTFALYARYLTWNHDQALRWHEEPESIFGPRRIWVPVSAGGGAQTVTIGQATETDSAQAFVAAQARAIGQVSETDSAQTLTSLLTVAVGQAAETDSAQALQAAQSRAIAQATETDSATAIAAAQARAIAQATETDEAIAVAAAQARAIAQATETDAAQAFTAAQAMAIGQAAESDAAQPVAYAAPGSIAQAQESDSAQPIVVHHRIAIAQAAETDAAQAVAVSNGITVAIGMALEIDVGQPLAGIRLGFGQAAEIDTARTIAALLAGEHVASQRIYIVHDELRAYAVPDENRTYLVPDSNGTLSI